jgi:MFS family permease
LTGTERAPQAGRGPYDFGLLWTGQSFSLIGDQIMGVALPLLAVSALGSSAAQAALLPFALYLPWLVVGLPAGVLVDRLPRRITAIVCDAVQIVIFALIALLIRLGALPFAVLFGLIVLSGCAAVFFQVAYTSYVPRLILDRKELARANARLSMSESTARTAGPMVAGPLIGLLGEAAAVAVNCISFVVSVVTLLGIRHRERPTPMVGRRDRRVLRDMGDGMRFVFGNPILEPVFTCGSVYVLFLGIVQAVLVLYCRSVLHLGATEIGLVVGIAALGLPLGNLISNRVAERLGPPKALVLGATVSVVGLAIMPVAGSLGSVAGLVAGSITHGVGEGVFNPTSLTLRQTITPDHILGRVNAAQRFLIWGAFPLGSALAALIISVAGLSTAMWVGGLGTMLCLIPLLRRGILQALRDPDYNASLGDSPPSTLAVASADLDTGG